MEYRARILVPGARTAIAHTRDTDRKRRRRILQLSKTNSAAYENKDNGSKTDDKKVIDERRNAMKHI